MGQHLSTERDSPRTSWVKSFWSFFQTKTRPNASAPSSEQASLHSRQSQEPDAPEALVDRTKNQATESVDEPAGGVDDPSHVDSDGDSDDSDDSDDEERFCKVLSALDQQQLPMLAATLFRQLHPEIPDDETQPSVDEPKYGSSNLVFPLTFNNGTRWALRIPIDGHPGAWEEQSSSGLASQVYTMQLIKRETTIPVPEIIDHSSTTDNILKCPYIVMSWIEGVQLCDLWFSHRTNGVSPEINRQRNSRALQEVASAMFQLGKFTSKTSGQLLPGSVGDHPKVGPTRSLDMAAMFSRWRNDNEEDESPVYAHLPVNSNVKEHYLTMLDRNPRADVCSKGADLFLRQLINWITEPNGMEPFVLHHPDFNFQNIIVSEEGELKGIIDWDGVQFEPRSIGNETLPSWLTRDWDALMYRWTEEMENGQEPEGVWEDSPQTLACYRRVYCDAMAQLVREDRPNNPVDLCQPSLITTNLSIAVNASHCRDHIMQKVFLEIWAAGHPDWANAHEDYTQYNVYDFPEDDAEINAIEKSEDTQGEEELDDGNHEEKGVGGGDEDVDEAVVEAEAEAEDEEDEEGEEGEEGIPRPPIYFKLVDMLGEERMPDELMVTLKRSFEALLVKGGL
ncbi:hypothetical protein FZEAL_5333 [Fusarium zealandicum]|uniref:Aminoglycoside phosphotransferase domain-containing protein n=1 Tax=Fusarium zealandicum TaxID=1053134 RepID=A0A8H4UJW3_9HYPO|nr:hypothetical protein FZEAL_5333 [Fusarium zealandicum]